MTILLIAYCSLGGEVPGFIGAIAAAADLTVLCLVFG
jgi:hypothetical protein